MNSIREIADYFIKAIDEKNIELHSLATRPISDHKTYGYVDYLIHNQYNSASGFIAYALNYVNIFATELESADSYRNSLLFYQRAVDSQYYTHCNDDDHTIAKTNTSLARVAILISTVTVIITALAITF